MHLLHILYSRFTNSINYFIIFLNSLMEKLCQQFNSHGSKSAMRFIYFKIMTILFKVVLFFYFLGYMIHYYSATLFYIIWNTYICKIVYCLCDLSSNQVIERNNRSLRHYRNSLSSSILLQYNIIPTCTEIYIGSGSAT
jgi:hypothetical protein